MLTDLGPFEIALCHSLGVFGEAVSSPFLMIEEHCLTEDGQTVAQEPYKKHAPRLEASTAKTDILEASLAATR